MSGLRHKKTPGTLVPGVSTGPDSLFLGIIVAVHLDDDRLESFLYLRVFQVAVAENNDFVAYSAFPGSRPVKAELPRSRFARNYVGLKALSVVHIAYAHLLIRQDANHLHKVAVYGYASLISEV